MATFNIVFKPSVEKDLRSIPKSVLGRVIKRMEVLENDPFPRHAIKLGGAEQLYRLRIGDYRVVYGVDSESKQIVIHYIRHRREVYRNL